MSSALHRTKTFTNCEPFVAAPLVVPIITELIENHKGGVQCSFVLFGRFWLLLETLQTSLHGLLLKGLEKPKEGKTLESYKLGVPSGPYFSGNVILFI